MEHKVKKLIDKLHQERELTKEEWVTLLKGRDQEAADYLFSLSQPIAQAHFGTEIFTRGLVEFTNYCRNDCYYCGIRRSNKNAERYRLSKEDILACCDNGYELGFRTFVLQGGEDGHYKIEELSDIIRAIKAAHPDCALTLSFGEWSREAYEAWKEAGADRYLLRHETANEALYQKWHPKELRLSNRMECLWNLKSLGYQVGTGFMVGAPYQTEEEMADDFIFLRSFKPEMIGIGPFVPHHDTPFADMEGGTLELTLFCIGLLRLMLPNALIPATTALGTISPVGRELGVKAGANVIMPNLSPVRVRKKYELYDNKICTGEEAAECRGCLENRMRSIGYTLAVSRGDYKESEE